MKRRTFLGASAAGTLAASVPAWARRHRNLFNGDCCVYFYNPEIWQPEGLPYSAKAIHRFLDLLAASGVDTFVLNPSGQKAWYPSRKLPTILDGYRRGDREFFRPHAEGLDTPPDRMDEYLDEMTRFQNLYLDLAEAGVDWFAESIREGRQRGLAVWSSMRMNSMHGAGNPEGSYFNCPLFREAKYRLSGRTVDPQAGVEKSWMALNYAHQAVRDFQFAHLREQVLDYGAGGLELDWLRDPHCLEPPASRKDLDLMTAWMRDVRELTRQRARQAGEPCPLGLRIPANLDYLRVIGLDVRRWVKEGLVDFLNLSNYWQTPWDIAYDRLREELGPDVVFYGVIEGSPNPLPCDAPALRSQAAKVMNMAEQQQRGDNLRDAPKSREDLFQSMRYIGACPELLRGNAAGKLVLGAAGIETFNFFVTDQVRIPGLRADYAALRNLHDLAWLRGKPKQYCFSLLHTRPSLIWETPAQLPVLLEPRWRREFRLPMCAEPEGRGLNLTLQVVLDRPAPLPRLGVSFNGGWPLFDGRPARELLFPAGPFTHHPADRVALDFALPLEEIREGWNTLLVANESAHTVKIVSLELAVRQAPPRRGA
jgi:hypothetical protein